MKGVFKALLLLATLSAVSCFAESRMKRSASPSAHTSGLAYSYYSMPYSYSYSPYYSLLYGRKKRSAESDADAEADPYYYYRGYGYGGYGGYGYGYPRYGYGYGK